MRNIAHAYRLPRGRDDRVGEEIIAPAQIVIPQLRLRYKNRQVGEIG